MSEDVSRTEAEGWSLTPLTAEFQEGEHRGYVTAIEAALKNDKIRNIALSGNYGVGKSSILEQVVNGDYRDRVVVLSLSTLGPMPTASTEDSMPSQAKTPTNRIQQEIVKQLLYREESSKAPGSRFRRIEHFSRWREVAIAALIGLAVAVIFLLTGWTQQIAIELAPLLELGQWAHPLLLVMAGAATYSTRHLLQGRIHIRQFSAGSATVTLDEKSVSYFDQYLDEIVYFFEVLNREIVIFEDIDRFNDSHIFETLRALNTLLNAAPRIQKRNQPIRFIYAIKDSIFDQLGLNGDELEGKRTIDPSILSVEDPARAEAMRANRTKFFDIVIPVVPFITHRSARNVATQLLDRIQHEVKPELLDLAAQYVPDMRLLKNVRNEFIVFRDRIFSGEGMQLCLSQTDLFAMMLYKSTHLTDFENIRTGTSNLDELYDLSRKVVQQNVARLQRETNAARRRLAQLDSATARSERLGDRLLREIELIERVCNRPVTATHYLINGRTKSAGDLRSPEFWAELTRGTDEPTLQWGNSTPRFAFSRSDIAAALNITMDPDAWREEDREELQESIDQHLADLQELRKADMADLIKHTDFTVEHRGVEQSFDHFAKERLKNGLACRLMEAGYLNRNFTLYTSTFHGDRVTAAATNFLIHHVERGVMDEHFELAPEDVEAVIRERGQAALKEPALYNIAILDHLLGSDESAANVMIGSLVNWGEEQQRFLQSYLSGGTEQVKFIGRFAKQAAKVLTVLVSQVDLDDEARLRYVGTALENLGGDLTYRLDDGVSAYLADHYRDLEPLCSASITAPQADQIAALYARAQVRVPSLEPLSDAARQAFVSRDLYTINKENLELALGDHESLAFDSIRNHERVYPYVLANLDTYLAIEEVPRTIEQNENFVPVIEGVLERDDSHLGAVIARAAETVSIEDLSTVSERAWSALAVNARFPATFSNVTRYIEAVGDVDAALASVLRSDETVSAHENASEEDKAELAKAVLSARSHLLAKLRARIAAGLELKDYLDATEIPAESGELFGLLVEHDVITADSTAYEYLAGTDWRTRERFIEASGSRQQDRFKEDMTVDLVRHDLANILVSSKVGESVKEVLVEESGTYFADGERADLQELARYAVSNDYVLSLELVERMARTGTRSEYVIGLLWEHLDAIDDSRLFVILGQLGNGYVNLTSPGRGNAKVPDTHADRALLGRLKRAGVVSTWDGKCGFLKANKKHK